jgi:hypothetical protein
MSAKSMACPWDRFSSVQVLNLRCIHQEAIQSLAAAGSLLHPRGEDVLGLAIGYSAAEDDFTCSSPWKAGWLTLGSL